jgi:transcriptional antiterminator
MVGRSKIVDNESIYECMLYINGDKRKITISNIAKILNCSTRTIHRTMNIELKKEKNLLNMSV